MISWCEYYCRRIASKVWVRMHINAIDDSSAGFSSISDPLRRTKVHSPTKDSSIRTKRCYIIADIQYLRLDKSARRQIPGAEICTYLFWYDISVE